MPTNASNAPDVSSALDAPNAPATPPAVSDIYPCLFYRDAPAAMEWLERAFGFKTRASYADDSGRIAHAELSLGSSVIMLSTVKPEKGWVSPRDLPAVNQVICMYIDNVDAHYARANAAGAEIIGDLRDTDYGSRGYECRDPEGNVWCFGNYRPGGYWEA